MKTLDKYKEAIKKAEKAAEEASRLYYECVQETVNRHGYMLATGHLSDTWQIKKPRGKTWKAEYDFTEVGVPEIFSDLEELERLGEDFGCRPSNMEMFKPVKVKKP